MKTTQILSESKSVVRDNDNIGYKNYTVDDLLKLGERIPLSHGLYFESMSNNGGLKIVNSSGDSLYLDSELRWPLTKLIAYRSGVICYSAKSQFDDSEYWKSCKIESNECVEEEAVFKKAHQVFPLTEDRFLAALIQNSGVICGSEIDLRLFDVNGQHATLPIAPLASYSQYEANLSSYDVNPVMGANLIRPDVLLVHFCHESQFLKINKRNLKQMGAINPYEIAYEQIDKLSRTVESVLFEGAVFAVFKYQDLASDRQMLPVPLESAHCFYEDENGLFISKPIDVQQTKELFQQQLLVELNKINHSTFPNVLAKLIEKYVTPHNIVLGDVLRMGASFLIWKTPDGIVNDNCELKQGEDRVWKKN